MDISCLITQGFAHTVSSPETLSSSSFLIPPSVSDLKIMKSQGEPFFTSLQDEVTTTLFFFLEQLQLVLIY